MKFPSLGQLRELQAAMAESLDEMRDEGRLPEFPGQLGPSSGGQCGKGLFSGTAVGTGSVGQFHRVISASFACPIAGYVTVTADSLTSAVEARVTLSGMGLAGVEYVITLSVTPTTFLVVGDSWTVALRGPVGSRLSAICAPVGVQ